MSGSLPADDVAAQLSSQAQSSMSLSSAAHSDSDEADTQTAARLSSTTQTSSPSPTASATTPTSTNAYGSSAEPSGPPRQLNAIGSGGGGPPARLSSPSASSTSSSSLRAGIGRMGSGGPPTMGMGSGGPGPRTMADEKTRQMASATKFPPSLQARLAAVSSAVTFEFP